MRAPAPGHNRPTRRPGSRSRHGALHGKDTEAINNQIGARNDQDVQTLVGQNPELVKKVEDDDD